MGQWPLDFRAFILKTRDPGPKYETLTCGTAGLENHDILPPCTCRKGHKFPSANVLAVPGAALLTCLHNRLGCPALWQRALPSSVTLKHRLALRLSEWDGLANLTAAICDMLVPLPCPRRSARPQSRFPAYDSSFLVEFA